MGYFITIFCILGDKSEDNELKLGLVSLNNAIFRCPFVYYVYFVDFSIVLYHSLNLIIEVILCSTYLVFASRSLKLGLLACV